MKIQHSSTPAQKIVQVKFLTDYIRSLNARCVGKTYISDIWYRLFKIRLGNIKLNYSKDYRVVMFSRVLYNFFGKVRISLPKNQLVLFSKFVSRQCLSCVLALLWVKERRPKEQRVFDIDTCSLRQSIAVNGFCSTLIQKKNLRKTKSQSQIL